MRKSKRHKLGNIISSQLCFRVLRVEKKIKVREKYGKPVRRIISNNMIQPIVDTGSIFIAVIESDRKLPKTSSCSSILFSSSSPFVHIEHPEVSLYSIPEQVEVNQTLYQGEINTYQNHQGEWSAASQYFITIFPGLTWLDSTLTFTQHVNDKRGKQQSNEEYKSK